MYTVAYYHPVNKKLTYAIDEPQTLAEAEKMAAAFNDAAKNNGSRIEYFVVEV